MLEKQGFTGFVTFDELRSSHFELVPTEGGVYVVLRETSNEPSFLPIGRGGHFKGKNPNLEVDIPQSRWVPECHIIYIGKADKRGQKRHLRKRLQEFAHFGSGRAVGDWGGRLIWQLTDSANLLVCWKTDAAPAVLESEMIAAFQTSHGRLPYANLRR